MRWKSLAKAGLPIVAPAGSILYIICGKNCNVRSKALPGVRFHQAFGAPEATREAVVAFRCYAFPPPVPGEHENVSVYPTGKTFV